MTPPLIPVEVALRDGITKYLQYNDVILPDGQKITVTDTLTLDNLSQGDFPCCLVTDMGLVRESNPTEDSVEFLAYVKLTLATARNTRDLNAAQAQAELRYVIFKTLRASLGLACETYGVFSRSFTFTNLNRDLQSEIGFSRDYQIEVMGNYEST